MSSDLTIAPITYIKSLHNTSNFPYILCKYCAEPITESEGVDYFGHVFCSNDCIERWKDLTIAPITYIKSLHNTSNFPYILCKYCAEPITESEGVDYFGHVFCSNDCIERWKGRKNLIMEGIKTCIQCGKEVKSEDSIKVYRAVYCSVDCIKKRNDMKLLKKCKNGEMSFLDLPAELREIGRTKNKTKLKCYAKECPVCGTIFYISSCDKNYRKKYCSDRCKKIALAPIIERNRLRCAGFMSHTWAGGVSYGKYCHKFNADLKRRVREFFGNKCFLCGKTQESNGKMLSVHHVNYNKNACCDSSKVMLVPLCIQCHAATNFSRGRWEKYIENILKEQYDYKCYYTKEEYNNLKLLR